MPAQNCIGIFLICYSKNMHPCLFKKHPLLATGSEVLQHYVLYGCSPNVLVRFTGRRCPASFHCLTDFPFRLLTLGVVKIGVAADFLLLFVVHFPILLEGFVVSFLHTCYVSNKYQEGMESMVEI